MEWTYELTLKSIKIAYNPLKVIKMAEIQKRDGEKIIVQKNEYKGKEYADIRVYFQDAEGEWKPTKKGVTFGLDQIDDVIKALEEVKSQIKEK